MGAFFVARPVFAWVIAIFVVLGGVLSFGKLPVAQYPEVSAPTLSVSVRYPGASAQVLEESVIALIEQEMNGIENLVYMDATSELGQGSVSLSFQVGTNINLASVEVQNRIKRVEARLPDEVRRQGVTVAKSRRNYLLLISLTAPEGGYGAVDLGNLASSQIMEPLRRLPGVGEVNLFGSDYAMLVWLKPERMAFYNVTPQEVVKAIRAQNVQLAAGQIGTASAPSGQQLNAVMVLPPRPVQASAFGNMLIRTNADGSALRLKDIAQVQLGPQDATTTSRINGQPGASIGIKLSPEGNALEVSAAVKNKMAELGRYLPAGVEWMVAYDTSLFVDASLREVSKTLIEAAVLVVAVMWLFLGHWRVTLIPAVVVPVVLIGTLMGLAVLGYSINVLTLFAMVLAIGLVVDDAIVVVENVERLMREEQLSAREATEKSMGQIIGAIVAITLVLSAVFIPMAFFPGAVGAIYRQFSVTLVIAMLLSALMAVSLTPALCARLLVQHHRPARFSAWFGRQFERFADFHQRQLLRVLALPWRWLVVYIAIVGAVGWLYGRLPGGFLPDEDQGYFVNVVQLPAGATQERTLAVIKKVEAFYLKQPEVERVVAVLGFSFFGRGQNAATVFVRLTPWEQRPLPSQSAQALIGRAFGMAATIREGLVLPSNVPPIAELSALGGFDLRLQDIGGVGRERLMAARIKLVEQASAHPALSAVRSEGQEPSPQLLLELDRFKLSALGLDQAEVNDAIAIALGSTYVNDFVRLGRVVRVQTQLHPKALATPQAALALPLRNNKNQTVLLGEVTRTQWQAASPRLERYNGFASFKLGGKPAAGHSSTEAMSALEELAQQLPQGVGYEWSSTSYEERLSSAQAPLLLGLSMLVVFLALAALYESWSIPAVVMMTVPLGFLGALAAVHLKGLPNDVYFKVGLITIIGLAAKNAILVVQFARARVLAGEPALSAAVSAARQRIRPIVMTSLAFVAGVLPLVFSSGAGAVSRQAIGTGVAGGMVADTVLALFFVPLLFVLAHRYGSDK